MSIEKTEVIDSTQTQPSPCPVCGSYSSTTLAAAYSGLLSMCDVLVLKSLESLGKQILRAERSRYARQGETPIYLVHTLWQPDSRMVERALRDAWEVVPAVLSPYDLTAALTLKVTETLDGYVRSLITQGIGHSRLELKWRLEHLLGVEING